MPTPSPSHVVVVGAGMVGLSVSWFLQEYGVRVTILESREVAAGSSWGNAGWVSPGLTTPLPEPSVLRFGLRSLLRKDAPLYVPARFDPSVASFLIRFARHCTERDWKRAMNAYIPLNNVANDAYDELKLSDDTLTSTSAPIVAAFETRAQAADLLSELDAINGAGQTVNFEVLGGSALRESLPHLSRAVDFGVRIDGQRYIDPGSFTTALGRAVVRRGATLTTDASVESISRDGGAVSVGIHGRESISCDAAVLANGAWLSKLGSKLGVTTQVQAGRGYSFSIPTSGRVPSPIYFPAIRVACTPLGDESLRVAGTMEFRKPDSRLDPARIASIIRTAAPLLEGVDWQGRRDEWVGSRPVTSDGLPLIGESATKGVYVAGGHGMWGITLGPVTGRLLAEHIVTGHVPDQLLPFSPIR